VNPLTLLMGRGPRGLPPPRPLDFASYVPPASPNVHFVGPPGGSPRVHGTVPLLPVTPAAAWAALRTLGDGFERSWKLAEWDDRRQAQWVARSGLMNYPDIVVGEIAELPGGAGLWLLSYSLLGYSDFGVNRRRVTAWRQAFEAKLR
jgi:hypothetical protein